MTLPSSQRLMIPRNIWIPTLILLPGERKGSGFMLIRVGWQLFTRKVGLCSHAKGSALSYRLSTKEASANKFRAVRCFYINNVSPIQVCVFYLHSFKSRNCLDKREGLCIIHTETHTHACAHARTHTFLRAAWTFKGNWRGFVSSTAKSSLSISNLC